MEQVNWSQLRYHKEQTRLWTTRHKFPKVVAGRGSGKTELARRRLVYFLPIKKSWDDPRYFYGAPTYGQAKRVAWHQLLALIPKTWLADVSKSEMNIRTIFGSELAVLGLDKPQRIEGVQWDGGVVDESSDIRPGTFNRSILPALSWRDAWCWRIGVPKRFGIGATEYKAAFDDGLKDGSSFTWPSKEILDPVVIAQAMKMLDQRDFEEQFDAKWVSAAGAIFYAFDATINVRPCSYNKDLPILVGSDFNVDPMAWVFGHRYGDTIEIFDELWLRNTNTQEALNITSARYANHKGGWVFFGDASGKARKTSAQTSDLQQIREHPKFKLMGRTMQYLNSNPPVADRFAAMNSRLATMSGEHYLYIDSRCKNLLFDIGSRGYKPGTREADDEGDVGHITDALGYLVFRLFPPRIKLENLLGSSVGISN